MNILQFNVRLAEGGAAGVALDLHQRALRQGLSSTFVYGYGKGGKKSVSHDRYPQVVKQTGRLTSMANLALFRLFNRDVFGNLNNLYRQVTRTDGPVVLHFHVMHSYWLNLQEVVTFCQKVQENKALWPLFMDETVSERIIKQLAGKSKEGFVSYLMQHSDLTFEQAESIFYFQIHGCLTINRLMLQNNCRDWHNVQQTIDRFIRAGLQEFLQDGE